MIDLLNISLFVIISFLVPIDSIKKTLLIILIILSIGMNSLLNSTIIEIKQDGTGDFEFIQAGIDASTDNDTVLVYPGTYFENIDFNGKNITVTSLEIISGDENYISSTIINGNQSGSCVRVHNEETNAVIRGFTITDGSGDLHYNTIGGGGIQVFNYSTIFITNCSIYGNRTHSGGGIYGRRCEIYLEGTSIRNNIAQTGGGILIRDDTDIFMSYSNRCSIYNNYAGSGVDVIAIEIESVPVVLDTFTVLEPERYFANYFQALSDINPYTFDIQSGYIELVNHDFYISPQGNNDNSGLSPDEPLLSISYALHKIKSDSLDPKTIHIANGRYSETLNNQIYPLAGKKYVSLIGEEREQSILDGDNMISLLIISPSNGNSTIKNLTFEDVENYSAIYISRISNTTFENIIIRNCHAEKFTGLIGNRLENLYFKNMKFQDLFAEEDFAGLYIRGNNIFLESCIFDHIISYGGYETVYNALRIINEGFTSVKNCTFINNIDHTHHGKGIFTISSWQFCVTEVEMINCLAVNNENQGYELMASLAADSIVNITNCTFADNTGESDFLKVVGTVNINNCIFSNNTDHEIFVPNLVSEGVFSTVNIGHSNIKNGEDGVNNQTTANTINWLEGNIDEDSLFLEEGENPYSLSEFSPCIDAGTPDTTGLFLPPWDILHNQRIWDGDNDGTAIIDMGCYEYDAPFVSVYEPEITQQEDIKMYNFPNPFNPETTFNYQLPTSKSIELSVYNIKGQLVKTLVNEIKEKGTHSITWDGKDKNSKPVESGIYLYKLVIDDGVYDIRKCTLIR